MRLILLRLRAGGNVVILPCRHHLRAQLGVGCQHAMEANQVQPRAWNQGRQALRREGTLSTALMQERTATIGHGLAWLAARGKANRVMASAVGSEERGPGHCEKISTL